MQEELTRKIQEDQDGQKLVADLNLRIQQLQEQQKKDAQTAADQLAAAEKKYQKEKTQIQQDAEQKQNTLKSANEQLTEKVADLQKKLLETQNVLNNKENDGWVKLLQKSEQELQAKENQIRVLQQDLKNSLATADDL